MKHIVGLDIGTNSIGWALILQDDIGQVQIIKTGVHIFPIGTNVDAQSQKETTKNEQRRSYRGASRNRYRFKLRRENLKKELASFGLLPDFKKLFKQKGHKQSYELYELRSKALKESIDLKDLGRILLLLNKYRGFESNSKVQKEDEETGKVKKAITELEGFIANSGAKTIGEYFYFKHEEARELYNQKKWHNDNEPVDDRAKNHETGEIILFQSNGIRRHFGRYTAREMYKREFDKIWTEQMKYHKVLNSGSPEEYHQIKNLPFREKINALKEFKKTLYWRIKEYCIYYQRPLKSQKKYVSNCTFESGSFFTRRLMKDDQEVIQNVYTKKAKKVIPKSHPLFQEFRVYKKLNQIRYSNEFINKQPLKKEWFDILSVYLQTNSKLFLNEPKKRKPEENSKSIHELLSLSNDHKFFVDITDKDLDEEKATVNEITGNRTLSTFFQVLGKEKYDELKSIKEIKGKKGIKVLDTEYGKLELLWHHLYIAKKGLLTAEEWINGTFTDPEKWNLSDEQASELYDLNIEPDYGSMSTKVIKQILPFMRDGKNEYQALSLCSSGYMQSESEKSQAIQLKEKITQLKYQELRNPVVERAVSQSIKVVNAILDKFKSEINREALEIRIESTREFKKPRQERESERRKNVEKDKLRQFYADELNKRKEKTGIKSTIFKYSEIISKYELWLEMGYDKEFNDEEFKDFIKLKKEAQEKHRLWLECNRMCPYTGAIIPLSKLFSPEVEIEHIIPLSWSLDNSFNNKTLTYTNTNKIKGKRSAYEFMKDDLKNFTKRIKAANFSESKQDQFLNATPQTAFANNQLPNTSYIASFTKKKMLEVCRKVYFTNGSATSELRNYDWKISNLLDKIRYFEDSNIDMDEIYTNYYRFEKDYFEWRIKKQKSADYKFDWKTIQEDSDISEYEAETKNELRYFQNEISKFVDKFRNKDGKKDRSDHRHHAIDAVITACCSNKTIQTLSTLNALKEEFPEQYKFRDRIERPFDYSELKNSILSILVSHQQQQNLIKKRKNRIKSKSGIIEQITYAPQGQLHEQSYYGKKLVGQLNFKNPEESFVKRDKLYDDKKDTNKHLFDNKLKLDYKPSKGNIKWHYVYDKGLYENIKSRLTEFNDNGKIAFSKKEMESKPFHMKSYKTNAPLSMKKKNQLPIIKAVRKKLNIERTMKHLPAKDNKKVIHFENRWSNNESNYLIAFYKNKKSSFGKAISFKDCVDRKNPHVSRKKMLIDDEIEYRGEVYGINKDMPWLKNDDIVLLHLENENIETIDWSNNVFLKSRLFKVKGLSNGSSLNQKYGEYSYGNTSLLRINTINRENKYPSQKNIEESLSLKAFTLSHDKFRAIKVRLDCLGNIIAKGEECF